MKNSICWMIDFKRLRGPIKGLQKNRENLMGGILAKPGETFSLKKNLGGGKWIRFNLCLILEKISFQ